MSFESKIITNSKIKQRNLLRAARVASEKPDTGVTIQNKSAYFVIRDCADITQKYLAMLCYSSLTDPVKQLKGKFTKLEIIDFVARARSGDHIQARQLLCAVFADINKNQLLPASVSQSTDQIVAVDNLSEDADDIYGDYDFEDPQPQTEPQPEWLGVDTSGDEVLADVLIDIFSAK